MDGPPDVVVYGTAAVAAYGALLSTYNAALSRRKESRERERDERERSKDERRVHVSARAAVITDHPGLRAVGVRAVCDGPRPVTLNGFYLLLEDGRQAVAMPVPIGDRQPLPARLQDGEEVTIFLDGDKVAELEHDERTRVVAVRVTGPSPGEEWEAPWPRSE